MTPLDQPLHPRILTTTGYPRRPQWCRRADVLRARSAPGLMYEALTRASGYDAVVLAGAARADQATAAGLARLKPQQPVVLQDSTWRRGITRLDRLASLMGVRLLNGPSTHFCVLSAAEQRKFPSTWGVHPARVHLTPWYFGLSEEELKAPVSREGYVFAGGDSMRDYRPLIAAAGSVPERVRIAARAEPPIDRGSMPRNLDYGPMPEDEYFRAMCAADVVVVALAADTERSAGQNNYLNPMALGKLVIVTDGTGVDEYVEPNRTALVVPPGDDAAMAGAIAWALDPMNAEEAEAIARRGRNDVRERFSPDAYVDRLLEVVAVAAKAAAGPR